MSMSVFDRDKRIRSAALTMGQTFYLCTLNQFVGNNDDAWPSQTTLSNAMNAGIRSVRKWQYELEDMGVLLVEVGKGCQQTNRYSLNLDSLPVSTVNNAACHALLNEAPPAVLERVNAAPDASPMRHHMPVNAAPRADRKNKKDHLKEQSAFSPDSFDRFWDAYAKKVGRKKSEVAFARAVQAVASEKRIQANDATDLIVENAAQYADGYRGDRTFQKNPLTWLHGEHWNDETTMCAASDFVTVQATVQRLYTPDVRSTIADVEGALTPEQFHAVKAVGLGRVADARGDTKALAADYAAALGTGA